MKKLTMAVAAVATLATAQPALADWVEKTIGDPLEGARFQRFNVMSESGKSALVTACENGRVGFYWQVIFGRGEIPVHYQEMPLTYKIGSRDAVEEAWKIMNPRLGTMPKDAAAFLKSLKGQSQLAIRAEDLSPITEVFDISGVDVAIKRVLSDCKQ